MCLLVPDAGVHHWGRPVCSRTGFEMGTLDGLAVFESDDPSSSIEVWLLP